MFRLHRGDSDSKTPLATAGFLGTALVMLSEDCLTKRLLLPSFTLSLRARRQVTCTKVTAPASGRCSAKVQICMVASPSMPLEPSSRASASHSISCRYCWKRLRTPCNPLISRRPCAYTDQH